MGEKLCHILVFLLCTLLSPALGSEIVAEPELIDTNCTSSLWKFGKFSRPLLVIDNFYADPDGVRRFALQQDFNVSGNYPGQRTRDFATDEHKAMFEKILGKKIVFWPFDAKRMTYNGAFQVTQGKHRSWIHRDQTDYSAIVFLTPNAPLRTGTSLYRHVATGVTYETPELKPILNRDSSDEHAWVKTDEATNVYNRLVIFDGRRSHMSTSYFGTDMSSGRLFQTFFFNTEK